MSLAFVIALQLLPPRARAVLILRDVRRRPGPARPRRKGWPAIWQGPERAAEFLTEVAFRLVPEARFVETRANRQPALAVYTRDQANGLWRGSGLLVITVRGDQIVGLTRFESHALRPFGLPRILPDDDPPGTSSAPA